MIKEMFNNDLKSVLSNPTVQTTSDYFRTLSVIAFGWNTPYIRNVYRSSFSPVHNSGDLKGRTVPRTTENYYELQNFINYAFGSIKPIAGWLASGNPKYYLDRVGVYMKTSDTMYASDGKLIADKLTTDSLWLNAWNNQRVPYEKTILGDANFPTLVRLSDKGEIAGSFRKRIHWEIREGLDL